MVEKEERRRREGEIEREREQVISFTPGFGLDKKPANIEEGNNLGRRLDAGFIFQWSSTLMHIPLEKCGFMQNVLECDL